MKKRFKSLFTPRIKFLVSLLCALPICVSAQSKTNTPSPAATATNDFVAPQAKFIMPRTPQEGHDPFFPRSIYPYGPVVQVAPTNTEKPAVVAVELKLKATSGLPPHRLALINNHTFEAGEEAEVITASGRISIKCLDVGSDSATVQIGPERRVLRMRSNL